MKRTKRIFLTIAAAILLAAVIGAVCIGAKLVPTANHALRISELLKPLADAPNQAMHLHISVKAADKQIALDTDVYQVTEENIRYLALKQKGLTLYVADNILLLENGKAFRLGEKMQTQAVSYEDLLPQIGALYESLEITAEETENAAAYEITVTGDSVETLLAAVSLGEALPVEGIQKLTLCLTEKDGQLEQIRFSGSGVLDGIAIELKAVISDFRILGPGDYPIPDAVRQRAATVDPNELFSLTEDLYRLVRAFAPLADAESVDGILELKIDCGPIRLDTEVKLSDRKTTSAGQLDPGLLRKLPETVGLLCLEGQIRCTPEGDGYIYGLKLEEDAMQQLSRMILPELAQYSGNLTEGTVTILLEETTVTTMEVSIEGELSGWITRIPIAVTARFRFD